MDKENETISIELNASETNALSMSIEFAIKFMLATHAPKEFLIQYRDVILPLAERLLDKADKKVKENDTKIALDDLHIRFGDKESPKDKPNE